MLLDLPDFQSPPSARDSIQSHGQITAIEGINVIARLPHAAVGDYCNILLPDGQKKRAQVISFRENSTCLSPFDTLEGICPGAEVINFGQKPQIPLSSVFPGAVLDPLGSLLNTRTQTDSSMQLSLSNSAPLPLERKPVNKRLCTGIKSIDAFLTMAYGQRVGLFAPAGAGKSTLLGMLARDANVDLTVIALVGERGREVNEFLHDILGEKGLKKSILVVSTSDDPSIKRKLAPYTATAIAEHYRKQGKNVLLLVDSLTRAARAIRETCLSAGELPVQRGYPPSVFSELPRLLERAGNDARGTMTAIYTILSEDNESNDPLAEEVKSLLDGHIVLDRNIAIKGIRPAVSVTNSVSRLFSTIHDVEYQKHAATVVRAISRLEKDKDLLMFGGEPDPELAASLRIEAQINILMNQGTSDKASEEETFQQVSKLSQLWQQLVEDNNKSDSN